MFRALASGREPREGAFACAPAAGITVVTPNRRLAASLANEFNRRQSARGPGAWEAADILPLPALMERWYQDVLYGESDAQWPELLSAAQEGALWERVLAESGEAETLLGTPRTAALARDAWALAHQWGMAARLAGFPASEDARVFARWARRYEELTARHGQTDRARLPELLCSRLASRSLGKPSMLVAYGFQIHNPQQAALFRALEHHGVEVRVCGTDASCAMPASRVAFASAKDELRAAACWARSRLESRPEARIGIVVPELQRLRRAVCRTFADAMQPARALGTSSGQELPFNVSLGEPLSTQPLVAAALLVLDLAAGPTPYAQVSRFVRSAFIAGAHTELAQRASLDAALRRIAGAEMGLQSLRQCIARLGERESPRAPPRCRALERVLERLSGCLERQPSGTGNAAEWARAVVLLLEAAGHPGERTLDSAEYQALARWHELIAEFAALERVAPAMHFAEACARLARMAADTLFQPEAGDVPIQILGVLEAAGLCFDHLWVTGLTDEAWPMASRPNPFIPLPLQRAAGVPEASAAQSLELDRRITDAWQCSAGEVVLSHPLHADDRDLSPSPLIVHIAQTPVEELGLPPWRSLATAMRANSGVEFVCESPAPLPTRADATGVVPVSGGTAVFRDQAVCPFRAFSRHRLGAEGLEEIAPGLDLRERGTLLHAMLARTWSLLRNKACLDAASEHDLQALLAQCAETAINRLRFSRPGLLHTRFARLEKTRLVALAQEWLRREKERPAFDVVLTESRCAVTFGGITINAKLDRMDSIVGREGTRRVILDYKTGRAGVADWLGERPVEPQLPLYTAAQGSVPGQAVSGVAFACIKAGEMSFRGIASEEGLVPGVGTVPTRSVPGWEMRSWDELLALWRREFEALGREFASGDARVAPKQGEKSCRNCDLRALCRINERSAAVLREAGKPL